MISKQNLVELISLAFREFGLGSIAKEKLDQLCDVKTDQNMGQITLQKEDVEELLEDIIWQYETTL